MAVQQMLVPCQTSTILSQVFWVTLMGIIVKIPKILLLKDGFCYLNTQTVIGIVPEQENLSALGRGTFKLSDNFNAIGEYIYARDESNHFDCA